MSRRRKHLVNRRQFDTAKKIRRLILGKACEVCKRQLAVCGHHVYAKDRSGVFEIMLRCSTCEIQCHQADRTGNPPWSQRILERNNTLISTFLYSTSPTHHPFDFADAAILNGGD